MTTPTRTASFAYTNAEGRESIVVFATEVRTIASSNPRFKDVRDYCLGQQEKGEPLDAEHVLTLIDAGPATVNKIVQLSDRVAYRNGKIFFDGDELETALSAHLVRMIQNDDDNLTGYVLFLENLASNPRKSSRKALFDWVADRNLTITEDGCFIGYKGVYENGDSWHAGHGFVDGVEYTNSRLPNLPGSVVSIPRSEVDPERDSACSTGLHIGTRSYATSYGNKLIIVKVNPRDVVMVPRDSGGQKMRVCRYEVIGDNDAELTETTYRECTVESDAPDEAPEECYDCGKELDSEGNCPICDDPEPDLCPECGDETDNGLDQPCDECQAEIEEQELHEERQGDGDYCGHCGAYKGEGNDCPNV